MDADHERRGEGGEEEVRARVVTPLLVGAAPAERHHGVEAAPPARGRVAQRGGVGDQPGEEEQRAHHQVGGDGERVPHQGRAEVDPERALVRVGEDPVSEPRPSEMDDGEESRRRHREHRHRFRDPVHGGAEPGAEEEEDGRDERARVRDSHPEDEVGDQDAPGDGAVEPRLAHAEADDAGPAIGADPGRADRAGEQDPVEPSAFSLGRVDALLDERELRGDGAHDLPPRAR